MPKSSSYIAGCHLNFRMFSVSAFSHLKQGPGKTVKGAVQVKNDQPKAIWSIFLFVNTLQ